MYELKKIGKVFTSKFVWTGPSSYEKRIYRAGRGLTKVEEHCCRILSTKTGVTFTHNSYHKSLMVESAYKK